MFRKLMERIGAGWIFLGVVVLIYLISGVVSYPVFGESVIAFGRMFLNILPVLVLVFLFIFLANFFLDPRKIFKYLGEGSGLKGWLVSILGGIISTGPIYMWYPLLGDLKEKGMKSSLIAAFLYNRAVKIPLLPMMIYYFGWAFTIILTVYMIIFSVVNGMIVGKISR
jgi:uncharacterized membrane protein YraQ (UPF0718 family)